MPLTDKQAEYLKNCTHRWNIKTGAVSSGKSFVDFAVTIPQRIQRARGEGLIVLMGNTRGTLERNILEPMRNIWSPDLVGEVRSNNTATIFGKKVYCLGADNKKHVARIQGATFEYVYGDEITTWNNDVFEMLKSRLRCEHSHFDGTCNPDNPQHWFKKFLDSDADIYQQAYVIDDGVTPKHIVDELKKEYTGFRYDRYILGKWCNAEGLVYPMYDNTVPTVARPYEQYYMSCDFGIKNPTAIILWGLSKGTWYAVREYYHSGREENEGKTVTFYCDQMEKLADGLPIKRVIVDPSAAAMITEIQSRHKLHVWEAKNAVNVGIDHTAMALQDKKIMVNDCCKRTIEEFGLYRWDEKATEDKPKKEHDHAMDAVRYFVETVGIWRSKQSDYVPLYARR